jgi:hypothetical protein
MLFQGDEFKGKEADAFELFKLCHYRKRKKGYMPAVQSAIVSQLSCGALYLFSTSHNPEPVLLLVSLLD